MKFKTPIEVQAGISDGDPTNPLGISGYLLSSDGSNVSWVSPGGLSAETAEAVVQPIKANEALTKGDPLYIVGYQTGQDVNIVAKADSSDVAKMPVVGLADDDYANQAFGTMTAFGSFNGDFDTTGGTESWALGDIIFVKPGGGLTNIKPGGTDLIQNVAIVSRVNSQTGELEVIALGRTNDVPNLPEGRLFVGTAATTSLASDVIYVDEPNGRVGIGTTSPLGAIQIGDGAAASPSTNQILVLSNTATTGGNSNLYLATGASGTSAIGMGSTQFSPTNTAGKIIYSDTVDTFSFNTNFSTKMVINGTGNVGIGTTSPGAYKLAVAGSTAIGGNVEVTDGLGGDKLLTLNTSNGSFNIGDIDGLGDQAFISGDSSSIEISVNQSTSLYCDSNNRVGINEAIPTQRLHVSGNARVTGAYYDSNNNPGTSGQILSSTVNGTDWIDGSAIPGVPAGSGTTNYLARWTPDASTLGIGATYDNGTNVGIGTDNPDAKLEVVGTTGVIIDSGSSSQAKLTLIGDGSTYGGGGIIDVIGGSQDYVYYATNIKRSPGTFEANSEYQMYGHKWAWDGNMGNTAAQPYTSYDFKSQGSSQMVIYNNNVGIGTTNPGAKLDVVQSTASNSLPALHLIGPNTNTGLTSSVLIIEQGDGKKITIDGNDIDVSSGDLFINDYSKKDVTFGGQIKVTGGGIGGDSYFANGNVGIGTTSPLFKLDLGVNAINLNTATNKQIVLNVNGGYTGQATDQYKVIGYTGSIASNADIFTQTSGENLKNFYTGVFGGSFFNSSRWGLVQGGSTRFCVLGGTAANGAGNIGINTTSPSEKLEVAGKVYIENQGVAWDTTTPGTTRGALHFDPVGNAANNTGNAITFGASDTGSGSTAQAGIYTRTDSTYGTRMYLATTDSYSAGSKTRMTIYSNGNVGIGSLTPGEKLDVAGNIKVSGEQYFNGTAMYGDGKEIIRYSDTWLRINPAQNFTNGIFCGSGILRTDGIFQVGPSGSKFVVNSIGNVGINGAPSTTTATKLKVYGTIASTGGLGFQIENAYGSPLLGDFYGNFATTAPLYVGSPYSTLACYAASFNVTSDYRLKENEAPLTKASSRIKKLKPIRFNYINSENTVDGFLAHEVAEVIPEAVTGEKDAIREDGSDELQGLDLSKIVPLLTAALQESITKIEKLEQRIQTLENK